MDVELRVLDARVHGWGLPRFHSADAAGVDLYAALEGPLALGPQAPAVLVPTGIAIHIGDPNVTGLIVPRSGLGHRGLVLGNGLGVIDADYQGPLLVSVWNRNPAGELTIAPGERIAQLLFVSIARPAFRVVDAFARATDRGAGGFGSTGASANAPKEGVR